MAINDVRHELIVPKWDNSGRKIKAEEIEDIAKKMANRFGGVTITPSVLGCWVSKETDSLICEENTIFSSVRDSESVDNFERRKVEDLEFMKNLAKELGVKFGQEAIMSSEDVVEVRFIEGRFKKELEEDKLGVNWFKKML